MSAPDNNADHARRASRNLDGLGAGEAYVALVLAEAITTAARTIAHGMIEAARIRREQGRAS